MYASSLTATGWHMNIMRYCIMETRSRLRKMKVQLLMVAGMDRYFQIVRCFRDEDLRADRQPEFTQIDCEMAFVHQEDVLETFEGLIKHLFNKILEIDLPKFERMSYEDAMHNYGSDKPDLRFDMPIQHLERELKGAGFPVFDEAEAICGLACQATADFF